MNSSRTYLPSGLRRVVDNPDTQMLSRGRAPSALKRPLLGLDPDLWTTYRTFALKRPLRLSWPHLLTGLEHTPPRKTLIPERPRPVERTFCRGKYFNFQGNQGKVNFWAAVGPGN